MEVALKSRWGIARALYCNLTIMPLTICFFMSLGPVVSILLFIIADIFSFLGLTNISSSKYSECFIGSGHLIGILLFIYLIKTDIDIMLPFLCLEIDNDYVRGSFIPKRLQDIGIPVSSLEKVEIGVVPSDLEKKILIQEKSFFTSHRAASIQRHIYEKSMYFYVKSGQYFGLEGWRMFEEKSLEEFLSILRKEGVQVVYK